MTRAEKAIRELLSTVDIRVGDNRAWEIQVTDPRFFERVLAEGSLGIGEAFMDGWWDCASIDEMISRVLAGDLRTRVRRSVRVLLLAARARLTNRQKIARAFNIGTRHYDLGNELYAATLDRGLNYSCGYWKQASTLDAAQEAKLDLVCRKIGLEPGMRVLDIGCGWGGFAAHAAEKYGAEVVGVTVSQEQAEFARNRCAKLPVEVRMQDYRSVDERFDRIVSIGMVEHVGYRNYRTFMETASRCLAADGLFLLHTIGSNVSVHSTDPWLDRYIFPDGMLPSVRQLAAASEGLFRIEDLHNFGPDYDRTLMAWAENFTRNWDSLKRRYDDRFYRMWTYYLLSSAGSFRSHENQLWQIVYSPIASMRSYVSVR
ncbi:MAG TPA: cyclopropane fatty acyl phospholipid synthase [Spirochaetia bacterium]|nr:cyclopropane fatty acyl phospholipid synthase [Spirochaetia bacterium]